MKPREYYSLLLESANKLSYYYNILKNIEMRGHIDSLEYNNTLYQIERIKEEEDEICEKISSQIEDKDKLCEFCAYISGIAISEIDDISLANKVSIIEPTKLILGNEIPRSALVAMRISTRMLDLVKLKTIEEKINSSKDIEKFENENIYELFVSFEPRVDKQFLDILDSHIKESKEFEDIRRMYIDAKYSYAFVRYRECENELDEENFAKKSIYSISALPKILEYVVKISALNKETLTHKRNQRRVMLEADLIRALVLELDDLGFEILLKTLDEGIEKGALKDSYGMQVIRNILDFRDEDLRKFNNDDLELKRKF